MKKAHLILVHGDLFWGFCEALDPLQLVCKLGACAITPPRLSTTAEPPLREDLLEWLPVKVFRGICIFSGV